MTFEGQAAIWLEQTARGARFADAYPFPVRDGVLDFRPLLESVIRDRLAGRKPAQIARAFQRGLAEGTATAILRLCGERGTDVCVLSGGVFQNELLLEDLANLLPYQGVEVWTNSQVPPNDGGVCLGQAALAAFEIDRGRHA